jgi:hypothetical protein
MLTAAAATYGVIDQQWSNCAALMVARCERAAGRNHRLPAGFGRERAAVGGFGIVGYSSWASGVIALGLCVSALTSSPGLGSPCRRGSFFDRLSWRPRLPVSAAYSPNTRRLCSSFSSAMLVFDRRPLRCARPTRKKAPRCGAKFARHARELVAWENSARGKCCETFAQRIGNPCLAFGPVVAATARGALAQGQNFR